MALVRLVNRALLRSRLLRKIENSKRQQLAAADHEKLKYELQLRAFRQQVRLLDQASSH